VGEGRVVRLVVVAACCLGECSFVFGPQTRSLGRRPSELKQKSGEKTTYSVGVQ